MEEVLAMQTTSSSADPPRLDDLSAARMAVAEQARSAIAMAALSDTRGQTRSAKLGVLTNPLRLFGVRVLNYATNHVVAHVPSFALRRLWYSRVLGIGFGPGASVFLGAYVWFFGPREARRRGVAIGRNSFVNRGCTLDIRCGLKIGDNVSISPEVMILGLSHDYNDPTWELVDAGPVTIEDHAWIGTRAMILPGVTVGRGAVVAAGSIVTKDVAPMTVVAGVPAKPVGARNEGATAYTLGAPPLFE